jgi:hypothetical protein
VRAWIGLALALPCLAAAAGCSDPGTDVERAVDPAEIPCAGPDGFDGWQSTPWSDPDCPWLEYRGRWSLQIPHDLGREPAIVLPYLAFDDAGSDPALASGDIARIHEVTDTTVTVSNTTEANFYLRLVLR